MSILRLLLLIALPACFLSAQTAAPEPITGIAIARSNGTWMGLDAKSGSFVLSFYDAAKKPVPVDVARATARWQPKKSPGNQLAVLNPSPDGKSLRGNRPVKAPRLFKVYLVLLDAQGQVLENYVVDYHEDAKEE